MKRWVLLLVLVLGVGACGEEKSSPLAGDVGVDVVEDVADEEDVQAEDLSSDVDADAVDDVEDNVDTGPYHPGPRPEHPRELQEAASGSLRAGVGVGYLDGPVGIPMAGYGNRTDGSLSAWSGIFKASRGMYGKLTIKAMVLEVEGERVVLVKLPTMSSESSLTDGIAESLKRRHGLDLEGRILTGATHSHHAHARYWRLPPTLAIIGLDSPDEEVIAMLSDAFADTIKRAVDDLGPAEWAFGFQDDWDPDDRIYRDRRSNTLPDYPKDPRLSLLAVRRPGGEAMATLINFGMHGTVFDGDNDLLSEDAPGGLEMKFEDYFFAREGQPILGMFIQSGGGDAAPAGGWLGHSGPARIEQLGQEAAPRIYDLYKSLEFKSEMKLAVRSQRIDLRYHWMGYEEEPEFVNDKGEPYLWGAWQCSPEEEGVSMEGQPKMCVGVEYLLGILGAPLPNAEIHQTFLTVARLDDLFLVTLPGEPAYSVIKHLREEVERREGDDRELDVMAFGYSQDHLLYLTHPDDWYQGGYESSMSLWGPFFARYLVERQMQVVDDMLMGYHAPLFHEESPSLAEVTSFEPRGKEGSLDVGVIDLEPDAVVSRTSTVHFSFVMGDPALGAPSVVVEVEGAPGSGVFEPVASKHGFAQTHYDNSRYEMVTVYQPEPGVSALILDERRHGWMVSWQVPVNFPAKRYRLRGTGKFWDGTAAQDVEVISSAFDVVMPASATLGLERSEQNLVIRVEVPSPALVWSEEGKWPVEGWRLLDDGKRPAEAARLKRPLRVSLRVGESDLGSFDVEFSGSVGAYVLDVSALSLEEGASVAVDARLVGDGEGGVVSGVVVW